MKLIQLAALSLVLAGPARSAPIDTGLFVAKGAALKEVRHEAVVAAAPADVFSAWTTKEGIKAFLGVEASVDLKIGGPMELYFGPNLPEGQRGSEGCKILSYDPNRMLSFSWNAPPTAPNERAKRTWVVVTFEDLGGSTRVRLAHLGFGEGGKWAYVQQYFEKAWKNVLAALVQRFNK